MESKNNNKISKERKFNIFLIVFIYFIKKLYFSNIIESKIKKMIIKINK